MVVYQGKNTSQSVKTARKKAHYLKITPDSFKKAGIILKDPGVLSRSASKVLQGKQVATGNIYAQKQVKISRLNQRAIAGKITPQEYALQTGQANKILSNQIHAQTIESGRIAQVQGKSDRVNQATERALSQTNQSKQTGKTNFTVSLNENLSLSDGGQTTHTTVQTINQSAPKNDFSNFFQVSQQGVTPNISNVEKLIKYADNVDSGKAKKPSNLLEQTQYYYSQSVKPISDIGYIADELVRGVDHNLQPSALGHMFSDGFEVGNQILLQRTGTPENVDTKFQGYFKADPLRTIVQIPAELSIVKGIGLGLKYAGKSVQYGFSKLPLTAQTQISNTIKQITTPVSNAIGKAFPGLQVVKADKTIFYQGVSINNKPIIGISNKKLIFGTPKPELIPLNKINLGGRSGGELSLGYGAEQKIIYSDKALSHMENVGFINKLSKDRSLASQRLESATQKSKGEVYTGGLGSNAFKNMSDDQGKSLLKLMEKEHKAGIIEDPHGSLATRSQIDPALRSESGSVLRLGDLDVVPKFLDNNPAKFEQTASRIIQEAKKNFPLGKGEDLRIIDKIGEARHLELKRYGAKDHNKIFEVLVKDSDEMLIGQSKSSPTHIMGYRIPNDSVKMVDYNIKTSSLNYQGLTQTKTINAFQKSITGDSKAMIYPATGRDKDIVRRYWEGRQSELNQIKGGKLKDAKETREAVEAFKKLYPDLNFNKGVSQKVGISFKSSSSLSVPSGLKNVSSVSSIVSKSGVSVRPSSKSKYDGVSISNKIQSMVRVKSSSTTIKPKSTKSITSTISGKSSSIISNITGKSQGSSSLSSSSTKSSGVKGATSRGLSLRDYYSSPFVKVKPAIIPIILFQNTTHNAPGTKKVSHNFLGNTRTSEITGFRSKKKDIDVGDKRTRRLYDLDVKKSSKSFKKSTKKISGLMGNTKVSLRI